MHGGKRPGAGRPLGSRNKRTLARDEVMKRVFDRPIPDGESPLEFLLGIMRGTIGDTDALGKVTPLPMAVRLEAAKAAAPYIHHRLQAIEHSGPDGEPMPVGVIVRRIVRPSNSRRQLDGLNLINGETGDG